MKTGCKTLAMIFAFVFLLSSCAAQSAGARSSGGTLKVIATGKGSVTTYAAPAAPVTVTVTTGQEDKPEPSGQVLLNKNSKIIHTDVNCKSALSMSETNKLLVDASELEEYLSSGYKYCKSCSSAYAD